MQQSENISELSAALSKAQGEITCAVKDSTNPHFKSKYADLSSVWNACRAPLSKNGLAVIQTMDSTPEGKIILITTLSHSSGQWIRSSLPVLMSKMDAQGMGSALTYTRRYSLSAIVGVAPDDDDAEASIDRSPKFKKEEPKPEIQLVTLEQAVELTKILKGCDPDYKVRLWNVLKERGIQNLQQLPASDFDSMKIKCVANREKYQYSLINQKEEEMEKDTDEAVA